MGKTHISMATFAAGCFWGVQETFDKVKGVKYSTTGYTGGTMEHPTYEEVSSDTSGHAQAVQLSYDPDVVTYETLLTTFWDLHDPTTTNRQGPNIGSEYRSVIFYHSPLQKAAAEKSKAEREALGTYSQPIMTEIVAAGPFWKAEARHQKYNDKHSISG
ncbi:MAG TPA: peptide-methionine (S)-S-oxide reductase MsrA [Patescibacteria group bacterium]